MNWALARNADAVRTGLEDNIRITKERLARSNAELVEIAADTVLRSGRRVATVQEARGLLSLPLAPSSERAESSFSRVDVH